MLVNTRADYLTDGYCQMLGELTNVKVDNDDLYQIYL